MRYIGIFVLVFTMYSSSGVRVATTAFRDPCCRHAGAQDNTSVLFRAIQGQLRQSRVTPRLPSFLPGVDNEHPVYAVVKSANASGYEILLANTLPCEGQNVCLYGTIRGRIAPSAEHGTTVILKKHIRGKFIDSVCHAYCTQSYINWPEGGFFYSIGIKAEKKENLVKSANSAILKRPQTTLHSTIRGEEEQETGRVTLFLCNYWPTWNTILYRFVHRRS
jgi:hypothetical protein